MNKEFKNNRVLEKIVETLKRNKETSIIKDKYFNKKVKWPKK